MELSVPFQFLVPKRQYYRDLDYIESFMDPIIMETINQLNDKTSGEKPGRKDRGYTMLHACAEVSSEPRFLRDELITAMFAGRDNVAMALTWTLYELARHPDVVEDLRQVIQTTIGSEQKPTYENLKSMKMLSVRRFVSIPACQSTCARVQRIPAYSYRAKVALMATVRLECLPGPMSSIPATCCVSQCPTEIPPGLL
jgi:cytochrome P450